MTAADALRRLLADVEHWASCEDLDCQREICSSIPDKLDYLERLALDGMAGEADNLYGTCRDCQGPLRKDAVSHWCKGIAPKKPTNEGQP